jgi:hypothetical protein
MDRAAGLSGFPDAPPAPAADRAAGLARFADALSGPATGPPAAPPGHDFAEPPSAADGTRWPGGAGAAGLPGAGRTPAGTAAEGAPWPPAARAAVAAPAASPAEAPWPPSGGTPAADGGLPSWPRPTDAPARAVGGNGATVAGGGLPGGTGSPAGASPRGTGPSQAPRDTMPARPMPARPQPVRGQGAARAGHPSRGGPIRGFPPVPGQPDPVYPPGQFSPWNRPSVRAAWLGMEHPGDPRGEPDPGYSVLAISDPSADSTATQTMAAIDDQQPTGWQSARSRRDWRSHAEDTGSPPGRGPAGERATGGPDTATARRGTGPGQYGTGPGRHGPAGPAPAGPAAPGGRRGPGEPGGQAVAAPVAGRTQPRSEPPAAPADGRRRAAGSPARVSPDRRGGSRKRSNAVMAVWLLSPVLVVILVVAGYVYITSKHPAPTGHAAALTHSPSPVASASPSPTLGPWKHIESRTLDTQPLALAELFPARFTAGLAGIRTADRSGAKCARAVIGSRLAAAVHKAHCTQVLRASYVSANRKLMATIGVLNLPDVKTAEKVGRASGAREFIRQLPGKRGLTRRLTKGTGLEEADVLGHYLILTWAEFTNLHKPKGKKQLTALKTFSADLITGTANVSLSSRMVTGAPRTPSP